MNQTSSGANTQRLVAVAGRWRERGTNPLPPLTVETGMLPSGILLPDPHSGGAERERGKVSSHTQSAEEKIDTLRRHVLKGVCERILFSLDTV